MKFSVCLLALACLWAPGRSLAAQRDSLGHGRLAIAAVPLVLGGAAMTFCDRDFRELRNSYAVGFRHDYDDYLQYAPLALTWGLKACGVKSRSSWGRMIVSNAFSAAVMAASVNSLKYSVRVERPDGSTRNSFPSGHAATAFMAAAILHKEYGHRSPWFSVGGYAAAAATGITRQLNNRHWMSDILVGAGIGILSVELGYFFADLIYRDRGLSVLDMPAEFDRLRRPSFLSLHAGAAAALGSYSVLSGHEVRFAAGPVAGIRGAWFATPYVGVGGRLGVGSMRLAIDAATQDEAQYSASVSAGPCFSYPLTERCAVGSHLSGGYEYFKRMRSSVGDLGDLGGASIGTGLSVTCLVSTGFGVRFAVDYDIVSPVLRGSAEWLHKLTVGMEVCTLF
ncbi:MAG: phosphatase PAP2 family protein [Alistipes sp.]|nr:phosphatase PAP2 family protein [Alistipes sp.]